MSMDIDPGWLAAVYLLALRVGVLLLVSPIFSSLGNLVTVRVLFTLALCALLVSGLNVRVPAQTLALGPLLAASLLEVGVGAILAFGVVAAFGAFSVAGKILDIQSGFGIGAVFDPVNRAGAPLFSTLFNLVAVTVFFGTGAHHAFLRGIAFSLQAAPLGGGLPNLTPEPVLTQFGLMFSLGVALIAPVMFALFLLEAGLGVMSRVLPQMNVFVVGMPAKILATLVMLATTTGLIAPHMQRIYGSIFAYWESVWA